LELLYAIELPDAMTLYGQAPSDVPLSATDRKCEPAEEATCWYTARNGLFYNNAIMTTDSCIKLHRENSDVLF